MSDSASDYGGWGKNEDNRGISNPKTVTKRSHPNDSLSDELSLKRQKSNHSMKEKDDNENINYITQPPMLLFKHFLNQQEDNILVEDAMRKYNEYKEAFACEQLQSFFEAHKDEEWFMEKYHPDYIEAKEFKRLENIDSRKKVFMWLYENKYMDEVSVHINYQDSLFKLLDSAVILLEGGTENDLRVLEKKVYRADSPERTEIKIDIKSKNDPSSLKWDDFNTSSGDDDSDVEITSGVKASDRDSGRESDREAVVDVPKKELSPEIKSPEEMMANDELPAEGVDPRPLHKSCSVFIKNIHPKVFRSQLEELVKPFPGYVRIALQDPMPERKFLRRGWVTFERSSDVKNVVWELNKAKLLDVDLGAVVNKEISQRIRPTQPVTNHRAVMRQDVKYAAKLVAKFDKRRHLWESDNDANPLLCNITEHLVDEGSYEEEAYLGGDISSNLAITGRGGSTNDPNNIRMDEDLDLARVLDRLVLYLRIVHSYDYYSATEYEIEDFLPNRCGLLHARGNLLYPDQRLSQAHLEKYMKDFEIKAELVLDSIDNLDFVVASRLGVKGIEEAVEKFITDNTKEITTEKWLCPLSGKKFKGPDYVRKHILNKYADRIDNVKQTVQFFNNYILDPRRPQLPEHPSNRPNPSRAIKLDHANAYRRQSDPRHNGNYSNNNYNNNREANSYRKPGRSDFGNRNSNAGALYYSRKILNYNDISVAD